MVLVTPARVALPTPKHARPFGKQEQKGEKTWKNHDPLATRTLYGEESTGEFFSAPPLPSARRRCWPLARIQKTIRYLRKAGREPTTVARKCAPSAGKSAGCRKMSNHTNAPTVITGNCGTAYGMSWIGRQEFTMMPMAIITN